MKITVEELLEEVRRINLITEKEGFTITELSEETGKSPVWWRKKIKKLMKEGKIIHCGNKMVQRIDGLFTPISAYKYVDEDRT